MSFLLYQRSDPRHEEWLPLKSQQIRLRNLVQLFGVNLEAAENSELYFTLHVTPLSAPFYTSERITKKAGQRVHLWKKIEPEHAYYSGIRFSAKGCTVRIWARTQDENNMCNAVQTWGVYFEGLHRLRSQTDWSSDMFEKNAILFRTPFGVYTAESCIKPRPTALTKYLVISKAQAECKPSYKCKLLASLHRKQRAIIDEVELAIELKSECEILAFSEAASSSAKEKRVILSSRGKKIRPGSKKIQLLLKKKIEDVKFKVSSLAEEKGRAEGRLQRIKKERLSVEDMNKELLSRVESLNDERRRLQQFKMTLIEKRHRLSHLRSDVLLRKKQLISELSVIYPLTLIDIVKRYSINGVQLPESDYQGYEGGGQASVALGYTAHLVSMLCFFLGIPLRYPIRHFGSRSRILDHITGNIPEREREFPLYFKGKPDIFSVYGAYLLNKNIAQIRWYCGLVTQDLRATLPNLASLIHSRLAIKGWDQNYDDDSLEVAQELTEETDRILFRSENSISLDKGLDDLRVSEDKMQNAQSNSVTNIDFATNNSVAVGEICRGRAQEKFLTGWRKGNQAPVDEFEPAWLVSSMDADSDCGRRLSTCLSRSYQSGLDSSVVSTACDQNNIIRRRRHGQVSKPDQFQDEPCTSVTDSHSAIDAPKSAVGDKSHCIPDGSLQARQLRLLDRKISMYFGDRATNSSGRAVLRRTRSYDKMFSGGYSSLFFQNDFDSPHFHQPQQPSSGLRQKYDKIPFPKFDQANSPRQRADLKVSIGEPYFRCNANSENSDIETDSCDFHVNPPVEAEVTQKNNETILVNDNSTTCTENVSQHGATCTDPDPEVGFAADGKIKNEEIYSHSTVVIKTGEKTAESEIDPEDNNDNVGIVSHDETGDDEVEVDFSDIASFLEEAGQGSDRGLDDESLWNRTEALMSSYQSFNLIRKSAVEPK